MHKIPIKLSNHVIFYLSFRPSSDTSNLLFLRVPRKFVSRRNSIESKKQKCAARVDPAKKPDFCSRRTNFHRRRCCLLLLNSNWFYFSGAYYSNLVVNIWTLSMFQLLIFQSTWKSPKNPRFCCPINCNFGDCQETFDASPASSVCWHTHMIDHLIGDCLSDVR